MKHYAAPQLTLFASLLTFNTYAQRGAGITFRLQGAGLPAVSRHVQHGTAPAKIATMQKGTNVYPRLSANYDGNGTSAGVYANHDSSTYRYTTPAHMGFDLTGNVPQVTSYGMILDGECDTSTNYSWDAISSTYKSNFRIINLYDAQDRQQRSIFQTWTGTAWADLSRFTDYYNLAGNDTGSLSESWNSSTSSWSPTDRFIDTYDAGGNLIKEIYQNWDVPTSAWKNSEQTTFAYDANHDETYQLQQNWSDYHNNWYNYAHATFAYTPTFKEQDVASQYYDTLSSTWTNSYHAHDYYNTNDQLIAVTNQSGSGTTWTNSDSTSYTLLNTAGQPLNLLGFTWTSGAWQPSSRITTTNAGAGLPFVAVYEQWNGTAFGNASRTTSFYNTYDKPTAIYTESWNGSGWVVNTSGMAKRYYYDLISTGVKDMPAGTNIQAYLYPIPASDKINLAVHWSVPQECTGTICDALGRQVAQWTDKAEEFYTREMPVASLPAGQYYLRLQGRTARWTHAFTVVH